MSENALRTVLMSDWTSLLSSRPSALTIESIELPLAHESVVVSPTVTVVQPPLSSTVTSWLPLAKCILKPSTVTVRRSLEPATVNLVSEKPMLTLSLSSELCALSMNSGA